jgi:hypothetical protein
MEYERFIKTKHRVIEECGFDYDFSHDFLYPFQKDVVEWAIRLGRSALFADCGLGKTPMQLAWADSVQRKTNKPILIMTPLAVSEQTIREAEKFAIEAYHTRDGDISSGINVTNYERLHKYSPADFSGVVLDESSILKNYAGKYREKITEFMEPIPYRMLCTATPAPNDHMELGTSSEALGIMKRTEMLSVYFTHDSGDTNKWVLSGHAKKPFWEFMAGWSRALRRPSDIGDFDDSRFVLPEMKMIQHTLKSKAINTLFAVEAVTLAEQRAERRATMDERCDKVADIANQDSEPFIAWCSLNDESKKLQSKINGAVEITGSDSDDEKERKMLGFSDGSIRAIVTKPSIAGFGMNWQHCNRMSFFPSHSHEQFYQASRRCWRFGQKREVECNIVTTEAERSVTKNMERKEALSHELFDGIVAGMREYQSGKKAKTYNAEKKMEMPKW